MKEKIGFSLNPLIFRMMATHFDIPFDKYRDKKTENDTRVWGMDRRSCEMMIYCILKKNG